MIHIKDFDTKFAGQMFLDTGNSAKYECVGYGDCNNAPYLIGIALDNNGSMIIRTVLLKNVLFLQP